MSYFPISISRRFRVIFTLFINIALIGPVHGQSGDSTGGSCPTPTIPPPQGEDDPGCLALSAIVPGFGVVAGQIQTGKADIQGANQILNQTNNSLQNQAALRGPLSADGTAQLSDQSANNNNMAMNSQLAALLAEGTAADNADDLNKQSQTALATDQQTCVSFYTKDYNEPTCGAQPDGDPGQVQPQATCKAGTGKVAQQKTQQAIKQCQDRCAQDQAVIAQAAQQCKSTALAAAAKANQDKSATKAFNAAQLASLAQNALSQLGKGSGGGGSGSGQQSGGQPSSGSGSGSPSSGSTPDLSPDGAFNDSTPDLGTASLPGFSPTPDTSSTGTGTTTTTPTATGSVATTSGLGTSLTPTALTSTDPTASPSSTLSTTPASGTSAVAGSGGPTVTDSLDPAVAALASSGGVAGTGVGAGVGSSESGFGGSSGGGAARALAGLNLDNPNGADALNAGPDAPHALFDLTPTSQISATTNGANGAPKSASLFQMNTAPYAKFMKQYGRALLTTGLSPAQTTMRAPASN